MRDMDHGKSPAGSEKFWKSATFYVCLWVLFLESLDFTWYSRAGDADDWRMQKAKHECLDVGAG